MEKAEPTNEDLAMMMMKACNTEPAAPGVKEGEEKFKVEEDGKEDKKPMPPVSIEFIKEMPKPEEVKQEANITPIKPEEKIKPEETNKQEQKAPESVPVPANLVVG